MKKGPGGCGKAWSAEEEDFLRRLYADGDSNALAETLGRSGDAVRIRARKIGLRKSAAYLQKVLIAARSIPNAGRFQKQYDEELLTHESPTHKSWCSMRSRCLDTGNTSYGRYGGRGITICERWSDYAAFLADMGPRPSMKHSIDRINTWGNYEPGNCRWATAREQQRNLSNNVYVTAFGERKLLVEWLEDERCSVNDSALRMRLKKGRLTPEQAISRPSNRVHEQPGSLAMVASA